MVGGGLGLVVGIAAALFLSARSRVVAAVVLVVLAVGVVVTLRAIREPRPESEPFVRKEHFRPAFLLRMNVGKTDEILVATSPPDRPIPFTELEIFTASERIEHTGWDADLALCQAPLTHDDLAALLPLVQAAHEEAAAGHCRTENPDDYPVSINISIENDRTSATVQADCLGERPAMLALADAVEELAGRVCPGR